MIKTITDGLGESAKANATMGNRYELFPRLIGLYTPLIKAAPASGWTESEPTFSNDDSAGKRTSGRVGSYTGMFNRADQVHKALPGPGASIAASGVPLVEVWGDSLTWERFDNQPSIGWTESELWDAKQISIA